MPSAVPVSDAALARMQTRQALFAQVRHTRTGINGISWLATDFLNQFNEVAMTLDMLGDWPDMVDELRTWQPSTYPEHFRRSGLADAELIIAAYEAAPRMIRERFDTLAWQLSRSVVEGLRALLRSADPALNAGGLEAAAALSQDIRQHVTLLAAMVNCGHVSTEGESTLPADTSAESGMDQADIDALFD